MSSQFKLLRTRRFLPFFITQALGAFNDNVFKQSLILAILYKLSIEGDRTFWINLCALLFILPFFLFSALAGQLGERFDKHRLIRAVKLAEILIMGVAAAGFLTSHLPVLLVALFAMGTHSAVFGPVKYSILPQALQRQELLGGNGLVEMGTFLAILGGTIGAGMLMAETLYAPSVAVAMVTVAVLGYLASRFIPPAPAAAPHTRIRWNIPAQTLHTLRLGLGQPKAVSRSLLGNSWFWFVGAIYLTQIPSYAKTWLHGDETAVTLVLTTFSVGIALGSVLCERLSGRQVEIGLVPFGSFGLTLFGLLWWWHSGQVATPVEAGYGWLELLGQPGVWPVLVDILGLGIFGGFYIVPLYALIQARTPAHERAQVIAANNILNALFMVISAVVAVGLLSGAGLSIPQLFLVVSLMNVAVNAYIFKIVPEFSVRFLVWLLSHSMYRVRHRGLEHIPEEGPGLLMCNHVSFVDALILAGAIRRPVRFVMYYRIYNLPVLNFFFRTVGAIPIAGRSEDLLIYERAFRDIAGYLAVGELVCVFPEGKLTRDGEIDAFKSGITTILQQTPVPVIPMALRGLWGSFFSRAPHKGLFKRFWSRVEVAAGPSVGPDEHTPGVLRERVQALRGDWR
ncbi:MFS transporter [Pseudomonas massiliensis]|uniref:MFS transporter n=1 Tax=Pseudomonas massiliensis TaxID=522492 RepID=UPI00058D97AF|nr:MFS transporter [Pseudomonas massiliensis]